MDSGERRYRRRPVGPPGSGCYWFVPGSVRSAGCRRVRRVGDPNSQPGLPESAGAAGRSRVGRRRRKLRAADRRGTCADPSRGCVGWWESADAAATPARRDVFWWLTRLGFMRVSTASLFGRRMQRRGEFLIGTSRGRLKRAGVGFRARLVAAQGCTARSPTAATWTSLWSYGRPDTTPTTAGSPSPVSCGTGTSCTGRVPDTPGCTSLACLGSTLAARHSSASLPPPPPNSPTRSPAG
jgi:hypothetical protein